MRLLFLVSRDWTHPQATGGDACTCDYARYMAARGHAVTLIAARYPGSARQEMRDGVRIVRPGGMFLLAMHAYAYYLRHRKAFDIVFEEGMASVRLPFLAPLYVGRPLVAIWYQLNAPLFAQQYPRPVAAVLALAERLVLSPHRGHPMLALSADRREELVRAGLAGEQVTIMPPLMLDSQPAEVPQHSREPVVVWIGKIRRYKCPHHLVEAMPAIVRQVPGARLVIAGRRDDEAYERELLELADRLGIGDRVEVRLNVSDREKWDLLARSRVLAVTSPVEGFSIVIIEANRCGTPVVATDGVPVDTARDGYNALRVPFGDRRAMASAVVRLLSDGPTFDALSRNARALGEEFSAERTGRRFEETMERVRQRGRSPEPAPELSIRERVYNAVWSAGVRARNVAKRLRILGPIEPLLLRLAPRLVPPPSSEVEVALPGQMRMTIPPGFPSARSYGTGDYERDVTRLMQRIVKEGMTVVDLGANVGYYTLLASRLVGPSGRVYAFEPDPRNLAYLRRNLEANGCRNVTVIEKAVADHTGVATFVPDERGAEGWLAGDGDDVDGGRTVPTVTLDDVLADEGWPRVDLVKMDIEGSEGAALAGMKEVNRRNPVLQIVMELNPTAMRRAGMAPEQLAALLGELGFRRGYIIERGLKPFAVAGNVLRTNATYDLLLKKDTAPVAALAEDEVAA